MKAKTNKELIEAFINWLKTAIFVAKTKKVLDNFEQEIQDEIEEELEDYFKPVFSEEPPKKPGSPAALLGGAMQLSTKVLNGIDKNKARRNSGHRP